jgi:hypothetical protein
MINSVKKAFRSHGGDIRGEEAWKSFYADVRGRWAEEGVVGARLLQRVPKKVSSGASDEAANAAGSAAN